MKLAVSSKRALALSAGIAGLALLRADAVAAFRGMCDPSAWLLQRGADGAATQAAAGALWCVCAWLTIAVAAALMIALPGTIGVGAERVISLIVPSILRRALGLGVGATLVVGAASSGAALATPAHSAAPTVSQVRSLPAPLQPAHRVEALPAPMLPGALASAPAAYAVRPGDSLWTITQRCEPDAPVGWIADHWPDWYAVNRDVIGADPAHLTAGEKLHIPDSGCEGPQR